MRFVATGTGHCGTKWLAQVCEAAGIHCGHEKVYSWDDAAAGQDWNAYDADASLAAAAHLDSLDPLIPVVHLIRDPVAVARSFMGRRFFHTTCDCGHRPGAHLGSPYCRMIQRHYPTPFESHDPLGRTVTYIGGWNLKIVADCERYGLVRLPLSLDGPHAPRSLTERTLGVLEAATDGGLGQRRARVVEAIDALGIDSNRHPRDDAVTLEACQHADILGRFEQWRALAEYDR